MQFIHPLGLMAQHAPSADAPRTARRGSWRRRADPWSIEEWEYPAGAEMRRQLEFLARFAILAPSGHNRQPWKFRILRDRIDILADRSRSMPAADPRDRELIMSCGAALHHLRVAMVHYGIQPIVRVLPDLHDPDLVASVLPGPAVEPSVEQHQLFMAIRHRRTHRAPFRDRPIDEMAMKGIREAVEDEGVSAFLVDNPLLKERISTLVGDGETRLLADRGYVEDLAKWIGSPRPGVFSGMLNWRERRAKRIAEIARSAPLLAILSTATDTAPAWLATGQAISHVLLKAREFGIYASFINQPVVATELRTKVQEITGGPTYPQIVLRMGYGEERSPSGRRPVARVTITD